MATATSPNTASNQREGKTVPLGLAASVQIYKGRAAGVVIGTGYGTPLVPATSGMQFVGLWNETLLESTAVNGSGSNGTYTTIERQGVYYFDQTGTALAAANIGQKVYFVDDHTVSLTPTTCEAGTLVSLDVAGNPWVDISQAVRTITGTNQSTGQAIAASILNTNVAGAAQTFASLSIPANSLKVGDRIRIRGQLIGTTRTSTDTCALNLLFGSTTAFALASAFAHATTNFLYFDTELVVQVVGASGKVVGAGIVNGGTAGATTTGLNLASTTFDTTAIEAITISGTFSASNTTDQITVNIFDLDIIRA